MHELIYPLNSLLIECAIVHRMNKCIIVIANFKEHCHEKIIVFYPMIYLGQNNESQMGLTFTDFPIVIFTLANRFAD